MLKSLVSTFYTELHLKRPKKTRRRQMRIEDYNLKNDIVVMMKIVARLRFASELIPFRFEAISPKAAVESALKTKFLSIVSGKNITDPLTLLNDEPISAGERKFAFAEFHWEYTDPETQKVFPIVRGMPDRCTPLLNGNEILPKMSELVPFVRPAGVAETLAIIQANPDLLAKFKSFAIYGEKKYGFAINPGHICYLPMDCKLGLHWLVPVVTL